MCKETLQAWSIGHLCAFLVIFCSLVVVGFFADVYIFHFILVRNAQLHVSGHSLL